ncbi:MAG: glutamate 5-kinase, partial [Actinomycetota bacterium]|nr:glutamate 5-kinase [Actinomycetota bacterium]
MAKIGTSLITAALGVIDNTVVDTLCDQLAALRAGGHEVILVSSGAISAGVAALGMSARPTDMPTLQAISAAGQSRLMETYNRSLARHRLVAAQVLLVPHDFVDRRQYLHARQTIVRLIELGCIPIVNENDAIAGHQLRYGDNDRIAALVAHNVNADLLVLLTDTPGLFTADPRTDSTAELISEVHRDDPLLTVSAGSSGSSRGSGGMASKLAAAKMASWSGTRAVIAAADRVDVLVDAAAGVMVGTTFQPSGRRLAARKLWIGFASQVDGVVSV